MTLLDDARHYFDMGWTAIPLGLTPDGMPKRPLQTGWPQTPHDWSAISDAPWRDAVGLGLVLGETSDRLAVIDFDDPDFATALFDTLRNARRTFYGVRTGRNRGHLYFREGVATDPHSYHYEWHGTTFSVELKGRGQQVAAPPTPGYSIVGTAAHPTPVGTLAEAWEAIRNSMTGLTQVGGQTGGAGYGRAWRETLATGERNNALYVESCRLAEARMPVDAAISVMLARVQTAYAGTMHEVEVVQTVRSAYRRVASPRTGGRGGMEL